MANVKAPPMKRTSTAFLQVVVVLVGIGVLAFLIWEPNVEGVNAHATFHQKYLNLFVLYAYAASIPFFVAIYQTVKLLGYAGQNKVFSQDAVKALRTIKYCALVIIGFVALSLIFMINADRDDRPAGLFMRLLVSIPSVVVAAAAATFERVLQNAVDIKSENDLTV